MGTFLSREEFVPETIEQVDADALRVRWHGGHQSVYPARYLRQRCPCAGCVDEMSGQRTLEPQSVAEDLRLVSAKIVGNYAVGLAFSDAHSSGIYTFEALRRLCPCAECAQLSSGEARP